MFPVSKNTEIHRQFLTSKLYDSHPKIELS